MQTIEETTCTPDYSNSMVGHLGITFLPSDDGKVYAEMPVDRRTSQLCQPREYACGVQVSGNHISAVAVGGKVLAKGELIHKGSSSHIWNVDITTPEGKLVSTVRVVNFIIVKR